MHDVGTSQVNLLIVRPVIRLAMPRQTVSTSGSSGISPSCPPGQRMMDTGMLSEDCWECIGGLLSRKCLWNERLARRQGRR